MADIKLKSNTWKTNGVTVTIEVGTGGKTTVTYDSPSATGDDSFATYTELPQTAASGTPTP